MILKVLFDVTIKFQDGMENLHELVVQKIIHIELDRFPNDIEIREMAIKKLMESDLYIFFEPKEYEIITYTFDIK